MQEIQPGQIWKNSNERVRVLKISGTAVEIHLVDRGSATTSNCRTFSEASFRRRFEFCGER